MSDSLEHQIRSDDNESEICQVTAFQTANVCVPVTITPFATPGMTTTECCGQPTISPNTPACPSSQTTCSFTITQAICVKIPVTFGAEATVGQATVECDSEKCLGCNE